MDLPSYNELRSYYSAWFEENYCTKPAKPSEAVLAFARAVLQRYGTPTETSRDD